MIDNGLWDAIKQFLTNSDQQVQSIVRGIVRQEIAMNMIGKGLDIELIAEVTELPVDYVSKIKQVFTALRMISEGVDLKEVSKETTIDLIHLEQMKKDWQEQGKEE